jgi:two-component system, NtrC family, C4-dicarboxylate transport response regulator DctD
MCKTRTLKILIVDDEEIVRYTLGEFLKMKGHSPDHEEDGMAGFRAIQNTAYDVAFVDIRMPGMGGIQLLRQALAIQPHLSIIVMSGHGDTETRQEALQAGAFSFLYKPFRLKDVIDVIESVSHTKAADG